ncbi:MAG: hypothetical protein E6Q77_01915 [Rhizobium sp.]|nr:MAG: hypothetical protein E6Q77_01915 [Rhizobium sp.]
MSIPLHEYRAIITTQADTPQEVAQFYLFRKRLFVDKCGWDLPFNELGERDQFDKPYTEYCLVYHEDGLVAGFRAIRTDLPYLGQTIFPQLAGFRPFPRTPAAWEISRFGVMTSRNERTVARINYALMFKFAEMRRAASLVAIADLTYERFLSVLGIKTRRYGPPREIGRNALGQPLIAVAGEIPLHDQNVLRAAYFAEISKNLETTDAANVFGRSLVSA